MDAKQFVTLQYFLPKGLITWVAGKVGRITFTPIKNNLINKFIQNYGINLHHYNRTTVAEYKSFNDFFTRELKPNARPLTAGENKIVCPVDGQISEIGHIETRHLLQAKSHYYTLDELLVEDEQMYQKYKDGRFATIYLAPHDYHRIHMPFDGTLDKSIYVPGKYFSVNAATADTLPKLYTRNERLIFEFNYEHNDKQSSMLMILIGAMVVSGIETVWNGLHKGRRIRFQGHRNDNITLKKGEEMGRFNVGSTVILIYPKNSLSWAPSLKHGSYVKMGRLLGNLTD